MKPLYKQSALAKNMKGSRRYTSGEDMNEETRQIFLSLSSAFSSVLSQFIPDLPISGPGGTGEEFDEDSSFPPPSAGK